MNRTDRFDDFVSDWLHADAEHRVPEHLDAVLRRTRTERQRPAWSSLERWLPVDTATRLQGRLTAPRPVLAFVVFVALLLAAMGVAVYVGALRSSAPAFGLADNGRILVADGSAIRTYAADGTDPRTLVTMPGTAQDLVMSPDGKRLAMSVETSPITMQIVGVDDGKAVTLPMLAGSTDYGSAVSWSPDASRVTHLTWDGVREHLAVTAADGSRTTELPLPTLDPNLALWTPQWSPDGAWISFIAGDRTSELGTVYLIRPDGTDLQATGIEEMAAGAGATWSPDPGVQRLLFTRPGNSVSLYDLASKTETLIGEGFWPSWSPDGSRLSYWKDGTVIASVADVLAYKSARVQPHASFTSGCQDHPELADKSFCGPAAWSPDGTRVIASDITGTSVVSFLADGTGSPIVIPVTSNLKDRSTPTVWQPIRP